MEQQLRDFSFGILALAGEQDLLPCVSPGVGLNLETRVELQVSPK